MNETIELVRHFFERHKDGCPCCKELEHELKETNKLLSQLIQLLTPAKKAVSATLNIKIN